MSRLSAGTSGFSYEAWRGAFYPENLPAKAMLSTYASLLPTVELNSTFYRLPSVATVESWCAQVPEGFRFSVKAPRRISHTGRLKNCEESIARLHAVLPAFGKRLAAVLVQLPPNLPADVECLKLFTGQWGNRFPLAFEFRHKSWFDDVVLDVLRRHNAALCLGDPGKDERVAPFETTADFAFMRFRGESYTRSELQVWRQRIDDLDAKETFAYFKHEIEGPAYARILNELPTSEPS